MDFTLIYSLSVILWDFFSVIDKRHFLFDFYFHTLNILSPIFFDTYCMGSFV